MNVYFAPAARAYVEQQGAQWDESLVRVLSIEEILQANPKLTEAQALLWGGDGATQAELDAYINSDKT